MSDLILGLIYPFEAAFFEAAFWKNSVSLKTLAHALKGNFSMQTVTVHLPQTLRAKLQLFQNEQDIAQTELAVIAALEAYFESWVPAGSPLPAMYDGEDGPCEVIDSFLSAD